MSVLSFRRSRRPQVVLTGVIVFVLGIAWAAIAFPATTFEFHDGNLIASGSNQDWCMHTTASVCDQFPPGFTSKVETGSGSSDDAFGQGTKEDDTSPSRVLGSIPPQKSDLSRFYTANEKVAGHVLLYLAWERTNLLGSANIDFEANHFYCDPTAATTHCTSNQVTPDRTPGDVLIRFDFGGSGVPDLSLNQWITSFNGSAADCFSANALPCWGATSSADQLDGTDDNQVELSAAGLADGAVNGANVTDPINPGAPRTLAGSTTTSHQNTTVNSTFGEAGIDLTAAGIIPSDKCVSLGSAYLKSRSSSSFTAEVKDFVAPQQIGVTNCGSLLIDKFGPDGTTALPGAGFTISPGTDNKPGNTVVIDGGTGTGGDNGTVPDAAGGNDGVVCVDEVFFGTYTISESKVPAGYFGSSATPSVSVTNPSTCAQRLTAAGAADASFTNGLGSIIITKVDGSGSPLGGATFTVTPDPAGVNASTDVLDVTTVTASTVDRSNAAGVVCIDGVHKLASGSYSITEKTPPAGYFGVSTANSVAVSSASTCAGRLNSDGTVKSGDNGPSTSFTNKLASLVIKKLAKNHSAPGGLALLGGATFRVAPCPLNAGCGVNNYLDILDGNATDVYSSTPGMICIDDVRNLGAGNSYAVTEQIAPANYSKDAVAQTVLMSSLRQSTCTSRAAPLVAATTPDVTFTDTPLSQIALQFTPSAGKGVTDTTTFECKQGTSTMSPSPSTTNSSTGTKDNTYSGLEPGVYTCTVDIDP